MSAGYASAVEPSPHRETQRVLVSLGVTLVGLWMIVDHPLTGLVLLPLNVLTAQWTAAWLAAIGLPVVREITVLGHASGLAFEIHHTCTALLPLSLLAAAVMPRRVSRKVRLLGFALGAMLIVVVNQIRLVSLVWLGVHVPGWFDAAHVWLWPVLLTGATAGYWLIWSKAARR